MREIIASFGAQDYIALAVIAVAVAAAVRYTRKRGKKGCNGCCDGCALCGSCEKKDMEKNGRELSDSTGENSGRN